MTASMLPPLLLTAAILIGGSAAIAAGFWPTVGIVSAIGLWRVSVWLGGQS